MYRFEFLFGVTGKFGELDGIEEIFPVSGGADPAVHWQPAEKIVQCLGVIHHRRAKINKPLRLAMDLETENDGSCGLVAAGIEFYEFGFSNRDCFQTIVRGSGSPRLISRVYYVARSIHMNVDSDLRIFIEVVSKSGF